MDYEKLVKIAGRVPPDLAVAVVQEVAHTGLDLLSTLIKGAMGYGPTDWRELAQEAFRGTRFTGDMATLPTSPSSTMIFRDNEAYLSIVSTVRFPLKRTPDSLKAYLLERSQAIQDGHWMISPVDGEDCPGLFLHFSGEMTAAKFKARVNAAAYEVNNLNMAIRRAGY